MNKVRLTKRFTFEMAHALLNYNGVCKNIHGHSYKLEVCVIGTPINKPVHAEDGLLIDFKELKQLVNNCIINEFDHSLVLNQQHEADLIDTLSGQFEKVIIVDYQPTCENLILDFATRIKETLGTGLALHHLKLHETETAFCSWFAADN